MNTIELAVFIEACLANGDLPQVIAAARGDGRVGRRFLAFLSSTDEKLRLATVEALGILANELAESDPESVLDLLRRLRWFSNAESGNSVHMAEPAIRRILIAVEGKIPAESLESFMPQDAE